VPLGGAYYYPPRYYYPPDYYYSPRRSSSHLLSTVYVEQGDQQACAQSALEPNYWYYCQKPQGSILREECSAGWQYAADNNSASQRHAMKDADPGPAMMEVSVMSGIRPCDAARHAGDQQVHNNSGLANFMMNSLLPDILRTY